MGITQPVKDCVYFFYYALSLVKRYRVPVAPLVLVFLLAINLNHSYALFLGKIYQNPEPDFQINYPYGWEKIQEPNGVNFYSPATCDEKTGKIPSYLGIKILPSNNLTFAELPNATIHYLMQTLKDFHLIESNTTSIENSAAHRLSYYYSSPEFGVLKETDILTLEKDKVYLISFISNPASYSMYSPIIDEMVRTFNITSNNTRQDVIGDITQNETGICRISDDSHQEAGSITPNLSTDIMPLPADEEPIDREESGDEESVDEESIDEESIDEESVDEESIDEESVDEESGDFQGFDPQDLSPRDEQTASGPRPEGTPSEFGGSSPQPGGAGDSTIPSTGLFTHNTQRSAIELTGMTPLQISQFPINALSAEDLKLVFGFLDSFNLAKVLMSISPQDLKTIQIRFSGDNSFIEILNRLHLSDRTEVERKLSLTPNRPATIIVVREDLPPTPIESFFMLK